MYVSIVPLVIPQYNDKNGCNSIFYMSAWLFSWLWEPDLLFPTISFQIYWIRKCKVALVAFVSLFPIMRLQMCPQIASLKGRIITQVAFVWLFSFMCFQMSLQIAYLRGCKIAQVAFVWFFSTVYFHMCLQMACIRGCIVALVAFVWLFPTVRFQMYL